MVSSQFLLNLIDIFYLILAENKEFRRGSRRLFQLSFLQVMM